MPSNANYQQFKAFCTREGTLETLERMRPLLHPFAAEIAGVFYETLLTDPNAAPFLSHDLVQTRLKGTMTAWIEAMFSNLDEGGNFEPFLSRQKEIGAVHARIAIPMSLVTQGGRVLKREMFRRIIDSDWDRDTLAQALITLHDWLDLLVAAINDAYMDDMVASERNAISMRMNTVNHDLALECQRLRASLYDWLSRFLIGVYEQGRIDDGGVEEFRHSELVLWLRNKADFLLPDAREIPKLHDEVALIETLLAQPAQQGKPDLAIKALQQHVANVSYLLTALVEHTLKVETGRDPLTRLMTRRFLPNVLQRMCSLGIKHQFPFSVLLIDVDHFKSINDRFGHPVGDEVLSRVAEELLTSVRASDFLFRYGGEEFLVILGDAEQDQAEKIAESLRLAVRKNPVPFAGGEVALTISIGIASHTGHPDYDQLLKRADAALYEAKQQGRDRVVVG